MPLAGIELRYLVDHITDKVRDYYVSNIYGIDRDSLLFKMHHTEKDDLFMMISSTFGVWLTTMRINSMEPNRLLRRLRSDLLRLRLKQIRQTGSERIAYFTFEGFGTEFVLVGEFFGDGNILLCNDQMKILALQHSIDVRHRKLTVGGEYVPPPLQNDLDIFNLVRTNFDDMQQSDLVASRWMGRTLGLPKRYVEGIFRVAEIDSKTVSNMLEPHQVTALFETTRRLVGNVASGMHEPVIVRYGDDNGSGNNDARTEVFPIRLDRLDESCTPVDDFVSGLDTVFTETLVSRGKGLQLGASAKKIQELRTRIQEQDKAIQTVLHRSELISSVAGSLLAMPSQGILSLDDNRAAKILSDLGAAVIREKGVPMISIADEKIKINPKAPLQSTASVLYDEAKRQSRATHSINEMKQKTAKKLDTLTNSTESERGSSVSVSAIVKKAWYERYRWFFTSDGLLAIGGRDASSNSAVVRKHLGGSDRAFHAEIHGSPFFILKSGTADVPTLSMTEVAHATVCFSRAWREGMYGLSAYWVNPDQVKKSAPSGQFLPKGSFTIKGTRNFVRAETLRLAVGIIPRDDNNDDVDIAGISDADAYDGADSNNSTDRGVGNYALTSGPPDPIKKSSVCYAVIEPHGSEMVDTAKKIRGEFSRLEEKIVKRISLDEFVRALPAGKSQIKEIGYGGRRPDQDTF